VIFCIFSEKLCQKEFDKKPITKSSNSEALEISVPQFSELLWSPRRKFLK